MRALFALFVAFQVIYTSAALNCDDKDYENYLLTYPSKWETDLDSYKK